LGKLNEDPYLNLICEYPGILHIPMKRHCTCILTCLSLAAAVAVAETTAVAAAAVAAATLAAAAVAAAVAATELSVSSLPTKGCELKGRGKSSMYLQFH
jgi:hypothetical protein